MIIEVPYKEDILDVELEYEISKVNDSIGSYDYSGFTYYDKQPNRLIVERFEWDKSKYSEEENKTIDLYINNNFLDLEEKVLEKLKDY